MGQRRFIVKAGGVLAAAGAAAVVDAPSVIAQPKFQWRMSTAWTQAVDVMQGSAQQLARLVDEMSGGRFKMEVFTGGQIMPPFACFDAASQGYTRRGATMSAVGVRELKNRLTYYLRRARKGEEVIVTERGRPVAVLQSLQHPGRAVSLETRLARLGALGIVTLPTRKGFGRTQPLRISGPPVSRATSSGRWTMPPRRPRCMGSWNTKPRTPWP